MSLTNRISVCVFRVCMCRYYHGSSSGHSLVLLMTSTQNESLIEPASPGYAHALAVDTILRAALLNRTEGELEHARDYTGIQSYFSVLNSVVPSLATQLVSADGLDMLFTLSFKPQIDGGGGSATDSIVKNVRELAGRLNNDRFMLGVTGGDAIDTDIAETATSDFENNDAIILPIALLVLMLYLKSLRLMILPVLCVALSLFGSFAVMFPVARYLMDVASFAPSIMASLTVAMSIDYNLFLLTRYREEILSGMHSKEVDAIRATVRSSGEVILASGFTLAITFISLAAFPMNFLASIGIGACTTILVCVFVNLTFTPAMLCIFPRFFSNFTLLRCVRTILPRAYTRDCPELPFGSEGLDAAFLPTPLALNSGSSVMGRSQMQKELLYDDDSPTESEQVSPTVVSSVRYNRLRDPFEIDREKRDAQLAPIPATSMRNLVGVVDDDGTDAAEQARARARARVTTPRVARMQEDQRSSFWYKSAGQKTRATAAAPAYLSACCVVAHTLILAVDSCLFLCAVFSTTTPVSILLILIVLGASVPFFMACLQLEHTIDQNQLLPKSSDAYQVLQQVQNDFSPGIISPYHVLVTADNSLLPGFNASLPPPLMPLLTPQYFDFVSSIVESILAQRLVTNNSLISVVYAFNRWTRTVAEAESLALGGCPGVEASCVYLYQLNEVLNDGLKSNCSQISLETPFPPLSDKAEPFVKSIRDILAVAQALSNERYGGAFQVYLTGGATSAIDAVNRIFELFPIVIAVTIGIVLVLVSLMFRSLIVPLRLVVTLAIPLAFTYGLAVMIFQQHKVDANWISSQIRDNNGQIEERVHTGRRGKERELDRIRSKLLILTWGVFCRVVVLVSHLLDRSRDGLLHLDRFGFGLRFVLVPSYPRVPARGIHDDCRDSQGRLPHWQHHHWGRRDHGHRVLRSDAELDDVSVGVRIHAVLRSDPRHLCDSHHFHAGDHASPGRG